MTTTKTIASKVVATLKAESFAAYSLYAGQANRSDGSIVRFQGGILFNEKRNDKGRAVKSQYGYADGSQIQYTWTEAKGPQVKEIQRWVK
jgi:hypothetical protein